MALGRNFKRGDYALPDNVDLGDAPVVRGSVPFSREVFDEAFAQYMSCFGGGNIDRGQLHVSASILYDLIIKVMG